jgi:hypothetical protein
MSLNVRHKLATCYAANRDPRKFWPMTTGLAAHSDSSNSGRRFDRPVFAPRQPKSFPLSLALWTWQRVHLGVGTGKGELAMDFRAKGRLALTVAAAFALAVLATKPLYACDSKGCPSNTSNLDGVAANALPTYPEPAEAAAASEPIKLKRFTKAQTRTARRAQPRKATLAQRARAGEYAARKAQPTDQDAPLAVPAKAEQVASVLANVVANANAQLVDFGGTKTAPAEASEQVQPVAVDAQPSQAQPPAVELVSAEEFNDLDRAAWEANQLPKLMKLQASDSRAEFSEDDSRWAQTSTIGKLFVAFGALLTIGSAIRMFMA